MWIIEDTRQQKGKHDTKHTCFEQMGVQTISNSLPFGDYALPPKISVDTKRNMEEIAGNLCGSKAEHNRFKRECIKAKDAGCQLIVLVENDVGITSIDEVHNWINPRVIYNPKCVQGKRLELTMKTMCDRYGVIFEFCTPEESAQRIMEILSNE